MLTFGSAQYETDGYVVVPSLIPDDVYPKLCDAADTVTSRARDGTWDQVRVVGKQFPPWDTAADDLWGVQNLMHPGLAEPVFRDWYGSEGLLAVSAALMRCRLEDMQFGELVRGLQFVAISSALIMMYGV